MGERPIAGQRSIWVCVFGQTHIQVSLFSFVNGSEVSRSVALKKTKKEEEEEEEDSRMTYHGDTCSSTERAEQRRDERR